MASYYSILNHHRQQTMYADATLSQPNVPQSHYAFPLQPHGLSFDDQNQQQQQHQQQSHAQMQPHFNNGYNPGDAGSMPPPSGMGNMSMNGATMQQGMPQRTPQSYQAQMQRQQMPPSSPGYVQSPISYGTPTPPGGVAAGQFLPQPSQSPTKQTPPTSAPTSQPQMGPSVSPQNAGNPMQKPQTTAPSEQPPMSPESQKRENRKIDLLLEINRFLFQEIVLLQAAGRGQPAQNRGSESNAQGGQQSPTGTENGKDVTAEAKDSGTADSETKPDEKEKKTVASREYIECMRRLQANFAYLTNLVSRPQKPQEKIIERPPIMEAVPPNIEGNTMSEDSLRRLHDMYKSLKEMWPSAPPPHIQAWNAVQEASEREWMGAGGPALAGANYTPEQRAQIMKRRQMQMYYQQQQQKQQQAQAIRMEQQQQQIQQMQHQEQQQQQLQQQEQRHQQHQQQR